MATLTASEKAQFTTASLTQFNRLSAARRDEFLVPETRDDGAFREKSVAKLAGLSTPQMRARVNVIGVAWGKDIVVNYAPEDDYTAAQKEAIADGLVQGKGWNGQIADITAAGKSLKQRVKTLEGR